MNSTPTYKNDPDWKYNFSILRDAQKIWSSESLTKEEDIFFYRLILDSMKECRKIEDIHNF
jgi:hypothetical protein|tara:strand:+ start:2342 stop:2524 length:183 start_codon:yes stop_codon:yes gene_type:complete